MRAYTFPAAVVALSIVSLPVPGMAQGIGDFMRKIPSIVIENLDVPNVTIEPKGVPQQQAQAADMTGGAGCAEVQAALNALGFDVGTVDGKCGRKTARAISNFQQSLDARPTGELTAGQARMLLAATAPAVPEAPKAANQPSSADVAEAPAAAPAAGQSVDEPYRQMVGEWKGIYFCSGNEGGVTLTFRQDNPKERLLKGIFAFYPTSNSPSDFRSGSYDFFSQPTREGGVSVNPMNWIERPRGYGMVGASLVPSADGRTAIGTISNKSCGDIRLERVGVAIAYGGQVPTPVPPPPATKEADTTPTKPASPEADCGRMSGPNQADCQVMSAWLGNFRNNASTVKTAIQRRCSAMLNDGLPTDDEIVQCVAASFASNEAQNRPDRYFPDGWDGLGAFLGRTVSCRQSLAILKAIATGTGAKEYGGGSFNAGAGTCQAILRLAVSRGASPGWQACTTGTDPVAALVECSPGPVGSPAYTKVWERGLADCTETGNPKNIAEALATTAKEYGRAGSINLTCDDVVDRLVADQTLAADGADEIRATIRLAEAAAVERARIADEKRVAEEAARQKALAEENEQRRQAEAAEAAAKAEAAKKKAAEQAARAGTLAGVLGTPGPDYDGLARAIEAGDPFQFDDASFLFTGGIATALLDCRHGLGAADTVELKSFALSAVMQAGGGNDYSAERIEDMMGDIGSSQAVFALGVVAARSIQCAEPAATAMLENVLDVVQSNKKSQDGSAPTFIKTCTPVHGEASCTCVAEVGRTSYSNLYQMPYSRELLYDIMQRSPMAALMLLACGIERY